MISVIPAHLEGKDRGEDQYPVDLRTDSPSERAQPRKLDGQEWLLFAGVETPEVGAQLAGTFGLLGLERCFAMRRYVAGDSEPFWRKLIDSANPPMEEIESWSDWRAQCGLLRTALGCIGLMQQSAAIGELNQTLPAGEAPSESLDALATWPARALFTGARAAGMTLYLHGRKNARRLALWGGPPGHVLPSSRGIKETPEIPLTSDGFGVILADLLNPWLAEASSELEPEEGGRFGVRVLLPGDGALLGLLWLQLANAIGGRHLRLCAWERCPGPGREGRPNVFQWRWGSSRKREADYCSAQCQHAAAVDRERQRQKERTAEEIRIARSRSGAW